MHCVSVNAQTAQAWSEGKCRETKSLCTAPLEVVELAEVLPRALIPRLLHLQQCPGGRWGEADEIDPEASPCQADWHFRAEDGTVVRSFEPPNSQGALSHLMDMAQQYGSQVNLTFPNWDAVTLNQIFNGLGTVGVMFGTIDGEARGVYQYNSQDNTFEVLMDPDVIQISANVMPGGATYTEILMATYVHEFSHMYDLMNTNVSLPHDATDVEGFLNKIRELNDIAESNGDSLFDIPEDQNCQKFY